MQWSRNFTVIIAVLSAFVSLTANAKPAAPSPRIVALAPHLAEWMYLLELESNLVGVSAYSDFPIAAKQKKVIADANGINFKALLSIQPDWVLVWEGGNKAQDISRLESMGFKLFRSSPKKLDDIGREVSELGRLLGKGDMGLQIQSEFNQQLAAIKQQYAKQSPMPVFFYMWTKPLMTIGENAWANNAFNICNIQTIFADSPTDYPEVRLAEVLKRQPLALITTIDASTETLESFWRPHRNALSASIFKVNGAIINRFTPRIAKELERTCRALHQH